MRTTSDAPWVSLLITVAFVIAGLPGVAPIEGRGAATPAPFGTLPGTAGPALTSNYTVTFHAIGLAPATYWAVSFNGQVRSTTSIAVQFQAPNGTYAFAVTGGGNSYTPDPDSGSLTINGADVDFNISWLSLYNLLFVQSGLPNNSPWFVFLQLLNKNAYTPATITYRVPNGTYNWTAGSSLPYTVNPKSGVLVVNGSNLQTNVTFTPVPRYTVAFNETGLAAGFSWYVSFGGGANLSSVGGPRGFINWTYSNGSYAWTSGTPAPYRAHPSSGTVVVSGTNVLVTIQFTLPTTYPLTFIQHGLASGSAWSVTLDGSNAAQGPNGVNILFSVQNGSHGYTVGTNSGLVPYPSVGIEGIAGKGATVFINFSAPARATFSVGFTEQGLPNGSWRVTVGSSTLSGPAGLGLTFADLTNGTYAYSVAAVSGWTPVPSPGSVTVDGRDVMVSVTFAANGTGPSPPTNSSLAAGLANYEPAIVITALLILGALLWFFVRRGRGPRELEPARATETEAPQGSTTSRPDGS